MLNLAAHRFDRGGDDVATVRYCGGANTITSSAPAFCTSSIAFSEHVLFVGHAPLGEDGGAGR